VKAASERLGYEIENRLAPLGITAAADDPGGFVEQDQSWARGLRQGTAIHLDAVDAWIGLVAKSRFDLIHLDAALAQKVFSVSPGTDPSSCDQFLQPLAAHRFTPWCRSEIIVRYDKKQRL
jgi:hypothetical protein